MSTPTPPAPAPRPVSVLRVLLAVTAILAGAGAVITAVYVIAGPAWALLTGGVLLLAAGLFTVDVT